MKAINDVQDKENEVMWANEQLQQERTKRIKEVKDIRQELTDMMKEAEVKNEGIVERDNLKTQITFLQSSLSSSEGRYQDSLSSLMVTIKQKDDQISALTSQMVSLSQEHEEAISFKEKELESKTKEIKADLKRQIQELHEQHEKEVNELDQKIKEFRNKIGKVTEDKNTNESRLLDQIAFLKQSHAESLLDKETKFKDEISEVKVQLLQKTNEIEEIKKTMELERNISISNYNKNENGLRKLIENANSELEELRIKYDEAEQQLINLNRQHAKSEKELNLKLEQAENDLSESKQHIEKLNTEKQQIMKEKQDIISSLNVSALFTIQ